MRKPDAGFDTMDPAYVAPLVVFLAGRSSRDVTGQVFEIQGGRVAIAEGWHTGPVHVSEGPWDPADLEAGLRAALLRTRRATPVYGA